ncbi:MAG: 2-phosphosulfolactate phosphatase [Bacteroidales bacterium]|nr:2-phosphosulfolactate phosphatase [Bacteroidales bacterium]
MKIEVYLKHNDVNPDDLKGRHVIIIDVLRATTVMITALDNGANSVQTVAEVEQAFSIAKSNPNVLLAGERNAYRIEGFHLGNSPLEMNPETVINRDLIMCTSNGTQAVEASIQAKTIRVVAFINMQAVADEMVNLNEDFVIICSGTNNKFSLDDGLAAGMLINRIKSQTKVQTSDLGLALAIAITDEKKLTKNLESCYHVNILQERNFQTDLDFCLSIDITHAVPQLKENKFIIQTL